MKTSLICGAALAILGVAAAPLIAQTQATTSSSGATYVQTSKIIGTKVKTGQGEEVGVVKDVVLDRNNGCMAYTVLSTGGTGSRITGQSKTVAVPWSVYTVSPDAGYLTVNVDRDRIYNAPAFEYSRISDTAYTSSIYSHFGVAGGVGVSSATTTGVNATTTGATTNTGATLQSQGGASSTASPGMSASAAPTASVSPNATGTPNPNLTPPANSQSSPPAGSSDAKATASPKSGTRERSRSGESGTSSRHKESANQGGNDESSSEATGSSSGKKSSARKSSSGEESSDETGTRSSGKKSSHKKGSSEESSEAAPSPGEQE